MNYGLIETEISTYINLQIEANRLSEQYEARVQPDNEAEYNRAFAKARVTVMYAGSSYEKPNVNNAIVQNETMTFRFSFEARKMRGEGGFYNLLDYLKKILVGYAPVNCSKLFVSKYDLTEAEQNSWQPYLEMQCTTMLIQQHNDEQIPDGFFNKVDLISEFEAGGFAGHFNETFQT